MTTEDLLRDALAERANDGPPVHYDFDALMTKVARAKRVAAMRRFAVAGTGLVVAAVIGLSFQGPSADGTVGVETAREGHAYEKPEPEKKDRDKTTTTTEKKVDEVVPTTVKEKPVEPREEPVREEPKEEPVKVPPVTEAPKPPTTEPPKETPTTEPKPTVEFTAHAKFGECGEPIPFDIYYGTANPGAKVKVESEFGYGYVYANSDGDWELTVEFPEAPVGETIVVHVRTAQGVREFEFTRTA